MKMMKDYHNLYLKCDVLLLAEVFKHFRGNSLKYYGLCARDITLGAMLNMTKVELEFIPDPDMYILFEKGTRGGVSYISDRYEKVDNKYLKSYEPKEESKHIIYLVANNLHGYAVSKSIRTRGLIWIDLKEICLNINTGNSSKGCALEFDFE